LAYTQATGKPVRADKPGPTSTTCVTISPIPVFLTLTNHSSAVSPGPASTRSRQLPNISCEHSYSQALGLAPEIKSASHVHAPTRLSAR
jgi:hypothetical protein